MTTSDPIESTHSGDNLLNYFPRKALFSYAYDSHGCWMENVATCLLAIVSIDPDDARFLLAYYSSRYLPPRRIGGSGRGGG